MTMMMLGVGIDSSTAVSSAHRCVDAANRRLKDLEKMLGRSPDDLDVLEAIADGVFSHEALEGLAERARCRAEAAAALTQAMGQYGVDGVIHQAG